MSDARVRSLPVFPAGGPLADTREQEVALIRAARDSALGESDAARGDLRRRLLGRRCRSFVTDALPPRWMLRIGTDLDALRAGWRKTSNNLFRSLKKADKAGFAFREGDVRPGPGALLPALPAHDAQAPHAARAACASSSSRRDLLGPGEFRAVPGRARRALRPPAGVFHVFGGTVELIYNGSDDETARPAPQPRALLERDPLGGRARPSHLRLRRGLPDHLAGPLQVPVGRAGAELPLHVARAATSPSRAESHGRRLL